MNNIVNNRGGGGASLANVVTNRGGGASRAKHGLSLT
jgi:hypothetical protein